MMLTGIGSAGIGLVFGWFAMLLSADRDAPFWARAAIAAAAGLTSGFLFDALAFEGANRIYAALGGALGGGGAALAYAGLLTGLERRPRGKAASRTPKGL